MVNSTPSIVPGSDSETVYLVSDDFGDFGRCWREADYERTDLETLIKDLLSGQYSNPVRVIGFNTSEGWSRDVSDDVANELQARCARDGINPPACLEGYINRHGRRDRAQLRLV
jgi:hypothetical protein